MQAILKLSLLALAIFAGTNAAPVEIETPPPAAVPYASDAEIAAFYFQSCLPNTMQIIPQASGAVEYSCQKPPATVAALKHHLGSTLFVATTNGGDFSNKGWKVNINGVGKGYHGLVYGYRFAGQVQNDAGQFKAIVYPETKEMDAVESFETACTSDAAFCFDLHEWVCRFHYASRYYERACPLLKAVQFSIDA
ncbi:hypothetical protein BGZ73_000708 [Actinomortierella ambigua]|nr:hypothetical protein BGZ73_000708 [Actinomortierella ambigua]